MLTESLLAAVGYVAALLILRRLLRNPDGFRR